MKNIITILLLILGIQNVSYSQIVFNNLDSLLNYASHNSSSMNSSNIMLDQARLAKYSAILGILDINGSSSLTYTDNRQLPVNLFPAEIFGGEPGSFKEVQTGIRYNTTWSLYADVKLFNMAGYENLKLANLNQDATEIGNKISTKTLYENIASIYYNILNLNEQLKANNKNAQSADTLFQISQNKYKVGLVKIQDVNDSQSNLLLTRETTRANEYLLAQQYLRLKVLCDIDPMDSVIVTQKIDYALIPTKPEIFENTLLLKNNEYKLEIANSNFNKSIYDRIPTLSFFYSLSKQQYSNNGKLFDSNINWNSSSYIGLKLSISIPTTNVFSQIASTKYDYKIAENNLYHAKIETENNHRQLELDYNKAMSEVNTNKKIYSLRNDSYMKNLELYREGLIGLDILLNSFSYMVNSNNNYITSCISVQYNKSKIDINNRIK